MISSKTKQLLGLNVGLTGAMFAWSLIIANMSGIYSFLGAKEDQLGFMWFVPSVIAFITPMLIGYLGDKTNTRYGKRIPYIVFGSLLVIISMLVLPFSQNLIVAIAWFAIFTFAMNAACLSYRPLVADVVPENDHVKAYAIQALLIGVGAVAAYLSPRVIKFFLTKQEIFFSVPREIIYSFILGAGILVITTIITAYCGKIFSQNVKNQIALKSQENSLWNYFKKNPKEFFLVSIAQFFTWIGVMIFIIYFTSIIEHNIFGLAINVHAATTIKEKLILEKSVLLTDISSAVYMLANIATAFFIPKLSAVFSSKKIHIAALFIGAVSLFFLKYIHIELLLFLSMLGIGIAWASFNSIPYAIVAKKIPAKIQGQTMGIFNMAITLPQILVSAGAFWAVKNLLGNDVTNITLVASFAFVLGALTMLLVND